MPTPLVLPSFASGELSPALHGRVDLAKYQSGLATCLNFFVHAFGGASTRAGTEWVGEVYDSSTRSRLVRFQFNETQTYVLEFADQKMRVIMDGGYVLEAAKNVTALTNANPGVVGSNSHGFSNGDHIWIDSVGGMTQVNRRRFTAANVAANTFQLSGIDTSNYGVYTSGGTAARVYTISTPYLAADLALLKFTQSADTLTITHPSYAPRNLTRTGHTSWTLTAITFTPAGYFGATPDINPGCSTYHDGRQCYARTDANLQGFYASQSGAFDNFSVSTPVVDSDAITRTLASKEVNEIRFMASLDIILMFTGGAVWRGWPGSNYDVITPANFGAKPVSYEGCAQVEPVTTIDSAIFVTKSGKRVRDIYGNGVQFESRDLSILSSHLFEGHSIQERAYARDPDGLIWYVRDDGILLCFTYLKEHDVYAWSRHTTDGIVESVAAIEEDSETALYLSVARTIGGQTKRYVERMVSRFFATVYDAWCVDSGYRYDGWNTATTKSLTITGATYNAGDTVTLGATGHTPFAASSVGSQYILRSGQNQVGVTITAYTSSSSVSATLNTAPHTSLQATATSDWAAARTTLGGLWHLEGRTVKVFADGSVEPDATVSSGVITLNRAAGRILAGLGYVCDLETLNIEQGQPTMQGRYKAVSELVIRTKDTRGLSAGPTSDRLVEFKERTTEQYGYPTTLTTGDERVTLDPSWNSNGRVFLRQSFPLPATVVAVIPRLDAGA